MAISYWCWCYFLNYCGTASLWWIKDHTEHLPAVNILRCKCQIGILRDGQRALKEERRWSVYKDYQGDIVTILWGVPACSPCRWHLKYIMSNHSVYTHYSLFPLALWFSQTTLVSLVKDSLNFYSQLWTYPYSSFLKYAYFWLPHGK